MSRTSDEQLKTYRELFDQHEAAIHALPPVEEAVAQAVARGENVHGIAQDQGLSEDAVWSMLARTARLLSGQGPRNRVETGGLGSDTDPGVSGGYGDTGFGSLGNEPPVPSPEEPRET